METGECLAAVSVSGVASAFEGRFDGNGGHRKAAALCGGHARIHILYALVTVHRPAGIQVNLQVRNRFQRGFKLEVLHGVGGGRRTDTVIVEQPSPLVGFVDIAFAGEAERKIQSRLHASARTLSEHVAHVGQEPR